MLKKGQAAMEFLMTYGWAILVVLAAIGALAYFGVLSPDRFLPEKCTLPAGMACLDFTASTTTVTVVIQNSGGFDMIGVGVDLAGCGNASVVDMPDGAKETVAITCTPALTSGIKFKGDLTVTYTNAMTSLAHTKSGEIIAKIP